MEQLPNGQGSVQRSRAEDRGAGGAVPLQPQFLSHGDLVKTPVLQR